MKTQIKHRYTGAVLFECDVPDGLDSGLHVRHALEQAVESSADLRYADLSSADLRYADLSSANLSYANLSYADLRYANLSSADLSSADLSSANLSSADLRYANLSYANLSYANLSDGSKITGTRPVFLIGPIGSRNDTLMAFGTDQGLRLKTGCFFGPLETFREALIAEHDMNKHREEYEAALILIEKHFSLWGEE